MPRYAVAAISAGLLLALTAGCGAQDEAPSAARRVSVPAVVTGPAEMKDFDLGLLVPTNSRVRRVWSIASDQGLVEWTTSRRPSLYADELRGPWGLILWTRFRTRGFASRWRSYSLPLTMRIGTGQPKLRVELGDVTSDGRRDILVSQYSGNHGCGPHRVIATVAGRPRLIFRAHVCETQLEARRGQLEISDGFYEPGDSVCCPSFIRVTTKRWTGRRLVTASTRLIPQRYR